MLFPVLQISANRHLNAGNGWLQGIKTNFSFSKMLVAKLTRRNADCKKDEG